MTLEEKLCSLESYDAFSDILEGERLLPLQTVDTLKMLFRKKGVLMYDTGMGKTYVACALIKALLNQNPHRHFLMFVKNKQLSQTPAKMSRLTGFDVLGCTGQSADLKECLLSGRFRMYTVVLLAHSCLHQEEFLKFLAENKEWFDVIFIDEAHALNNFNEGISGAAIAALCKGKEFVWALTATPMTSSLMQCAKLATILDPFNYAKTQKLLTGLRTGKYQIGQDPCFWISRDRKDFGVTAEVRGHALAVEAMPHQIGLQAGEVLRKCKGAGAENQAKALADFIKRQSGKGLVFINEHATREWVLPFLEEADIRYACINGRTNAGDTETILYNFNELDQYDVLITSVTEALDLECSWVLFYEFTTNVQQMIGMAYRGFANKVLDVYFMVTIGAGEIEWFCEHILSRARTVSQKLDKYYTAVYQAAVEMRKYQ